MSSEKSVVQIIGLVAVAITSLAAAPPSSAPTTSPVRIEEMEPLADGMVRYIPPANWELMSKTSDGLVAQYRPRDQSALITITVMPQQRTLLDSSKGQMAMIIGKAIRESASKEGRELVIQPRVEEDPRFYLKVHDAIRHGESISDRLQIYRLLGLNLVHVSVSASVTGLEQSKDVHEIAEELVDTMRISRGSKRIVYPGAQLRAIVPLDWKEEKKPDQPNGLVATYSDPKDASRQIVLGARIIPKPSREDTAKRDALLLKMIDQERAAPPLSAAMKPGEKEIPGDAYLRQIRAEVAGDGGPIQVDTRYLVVGDVLASVRSVAKQADAEMVNAIADKFAAALKPIREPPPKE